LTSARVAARKSRVKRTRPWLIRGSGPPQLVRLSTGAPAPTPVELALATWGVIPVAPRTKRALVSWAEFETYPPSVAQVKDWADQFSSCNWEVLLGSPSGGIIAVDIDSGTGHRWCDDQGGFRQRSGPWFETGRGWCYLFRVPVELCTFGKLVPHADVEILGNGHCHVIPPSIHENGTQYKWCRQPNLTKPVPLAPKWVLDVIRGKVAAPVPAVSVGVASNNVSSYTSTGRAFRIGELAALAEVPEVALAVMRLCGCGVRGIGKSFRCPLPGHTDQHPSAALYQRPGRPIALHDFHACTKEDEWWPLVDVFAAVKTGNLRRLTKAERATWWLRALVELRRVDLPTIDTPQPPGDAPEAAKKLYAGFVYLLQLREIYEPGQVERGAPYSWRFAADWCGIGSPTTVSKGMRWLFERGFLRIAEQGSSPGQGGKRRAALLALGKAYATSSSSPSRQSGAEGEV